MRPVFCYRTLAHLAPGVLEFGEEIPCGAGGKRWRAQGPRQRPDAIDLLDPDGRIQAGYRLGYRPSGQVAWVEHRLQQRPDGVKVYELGQRYEFKTGPAGQWEAVTIRTELDADGRPVRVEKRVGGRLAFRVERTFSTGGLLEELTYDADGSLRMKRRLIVEKGKHFEEMFDATGRRILRRAVGPDGQPIPAPTPPSAPATDGGTADSAAGQSP